MEIHNMIKVVLIGACGHSFTAIDTIRLHRDKLILCGVSSAVSGDISPDRKNNLMREFGCTEFVDYRKMLDKVKPGIACVDSRFDLNGPVSAECLRRGIHCYTEKTIAHSMKMLAELREAATVGGAQIIGMHTMRYEPHFYAAWNAVNSGAIGTPRIIIGRKSYKFGKSRPDFYRFRKFYGGTILWVAIHALDLIWWTAGNFEVASAIHSRQDNFNFGECESSCIISLTGKDGYIGVVTADFYQPDKAREHGDDQLRIAGARGVIEVLNGKAWITTHDSPKTELKATGYGDFFLDFYRYLYENGQCRLNMEETFNITTAALYARDFADAGEKSS